MNTWLNQGRLRRPGRGLKKWEKLVESKSTNRLEHKNPDTPLVQTQRSFDSLQVNDSVQPERVDQNYAANDTSVQVVSAEASPHQSTMLMIIGDLTRADPASCPPTGSMPPCDRRPTCRPSRSYWPPADQSLLPAPG